MLLPKRTRKYQIFMLSTIGIGLTVMLLGEPVVPGKVRALFGGVGLLILAFEAVVDFLGLRSERALK